MLQLFQLSMEILAFYDGFYELMQENSTHHGNKNSQAWTIPAAHDILTGSVQSFFRNRRPFHAILRSTMRGWPVCFSAIALLTVSVSAAELQVPGVPNFHTINEHMYRGGQPSPAGFHNLAKLGVKTIVDLRDGRELGEPGVVEKEGMRYLHVPMAGVGAPTERQVFSVLHVFDDGASWPVFVHCRRGADRTGTVVACYRITHDHWQNEKALIEAKTYGMSWMERAMQNYILTFAPAMADAENNAVQ